jgi:hypothetical protein
MPLPRWPIALLFLIALTPASAKTLYVAPEGPGPDGLSWETAFKDIRDAISVSAYGDDIVVASGNYPGEFVLKHGRRLMGGYDGSEIGPEFTFKRDNRATIIGSTGSAAITMQSATSMKGFIICGSNPIEDNRGGGVRVMDATNVLIEECILEKNHASASISAAGGGLFMDNAEVTIVKCVFTDNVSFSGAGVYAEYSSIICMGSVFEKNKEGGGVTLFLSNGVFEDCTFGIGNEAPFDPIENDIRTVGCSHPIILKNTIARSMEIRSCQPPPGDLFVNSNIPGGVGVGGIDADPHWIDPENGDYRLKISSPCIDSGTITDATMDLNGNPLPVDVVGIGIDWPGAYDMGAFEFQLSPADLTRNGTVDGEDLMEFQKQWMREE